jgi:hypothetical protein
MLRLISRSSHGCFRTDNEKPNPQAFPRLDTTRAVTDSDIEKLPGSMKPPQDKINNQTMECLLTYLIDHAGLQQ